MLNYSLNNLNKTSYYILDDKNSLNISMTPFLFCSRNSILLLDVLKHVFLLKKSLYFFEKIFLERNRVMFLMENKNNINSLYVNNFINKYKNSISSFLNSNRFKTKNKYNYYLIKNILNLKKGLNNKFINSKKDIINLNFFKIKIYLNLYLNLLKQLKNSFLLRLNESILLNLSDYIYLYRLSNKYNVQKYTVKFFTKKVKNLSNLNFYRLQRGKFKNYVQNVKKDVINNKFIDDRFFNLYEVNFKIFFKFYSYMIKVKKWLLFFKKVKTKIYSKKYLYLKSYIKLLNINIYNFYKNKKKFYYLINSSQNINFNNLMYKTLLYTYKYKFIESRFNFWFNSWLNGGITNFYGLKKTYKFKNEDFKKINYLPDFIVYLNLEKKEMFLSELFLYEIPSIGFSSIDMNPFFFTYYIPSNNKNFSLFEFYFNLFLESSFRSLVSDSKYFL